MAVKNEVVADCFTVTLGNWWPLICCPWQTPLSLSKIWPGWDVTIGESRPSKFILSPALVCETSVPSSIRLSPSSAAVFKTSESIFADFFAAEVNLVLSTEPLA